MGFVVECDGETVHMPFDGDWMVPKLEGRFPNRVMLAMDEKRFNTAFMSWAVWTDGEGVFATLAFCRDGLTIMRHETLKDAIESKQAIDHCGCGGDCAKIHVIIKIDPKNSRAAKEQENIRRYVKAHPRRFK